MNTKNTMILLPLSVKFCFTSHYFTTRLSRTRIRFLFTSPAPFAAVLYILPISFPFLPPIHKATFPVTRHGCPDLKI